VAVDAHDEIEKHDIKTWKQVSHTEFSWSTKIDILSGHVTGLFALFSLSWDAHTHKTIYNKEKRETDKKKKK